MVGMPKPGRDRVAQLVRETPFQTVFLALIFALLAGMGLAAILGPETFRNLPRGLAIFATACSFVCTTLLGWAVVATLRRRD